MRVEGYGYLWWFWAVGGYNKKGSNKLLLNTYINTLMQREIPTRSRFATLIKGGKFNLKQQTKLQAKPSSLE